MQQGSVWIIMKGTQAVVIFYYQMYFHPGTQKFSNLAQNKDTAQDTWCTPKPAGHKTEQPAPAALPSLFLKIEIQIEDL